MSRPNFGDFQWICDSASSVTTCNLFPARFSTCRVSPIVNGRLTNLGTILLDVVAIIIATLLIILAQKRKSAVGRRETQILLGFYIVDCLCEVFTVGGILPSGNVLIGFSAVHVAFVTTTSWLVLYHAVTACQFFDDGGTTSILTLTGSSICIFAPTLYVALDTGYNFTGRFISNYSLPNKAIALFVLCLVLPLFCLVVAFVIWFVIIVRKLGEPKQLGWLIIAVFTFAVGQVFNFYVGELICERVKGKINGALFQTLFTLISIMFLYITWKNITEDEWPMAKPSSLRIFGKNAHQGSQSRRSFSNRQNSSNEEQKIYIPFPKIPTKTLSETLNQLDGEKTAFLDAVQSEISDFVKRQDRRDCIAIVRIDRNENRTRVGAFSSPANWSTGIWKMYKHKGNASLPVQDGYKLDSYLTADIIKIINKERAKFLTERMDVIKPGILGMIGDNPRYFRQIGLKMAEVIRESGEPITEHMAENIAEMLTHQLHAALASHTMDTVGQHISHALAHSASGAVVAGMATHLTHALSVTITHAVATYGTVPAIMHALGHLAGKFLLHSVATAIVSVVGTNVVASGGAKAVGALLGPAAMLLAAGFIIKNVITFPTTLAKDIAPEIRKVLAGDGFREQNKSVLEEIFNKTIKDLGKKLGLAMATEIGKETPVGKEVVEAWEAFKKSKEEAALKFAKKHF